MPSYCRPPRLLIVGATGWYGKTFVDEYVRQYGYQAAAANLLLFASCSQQFSLELDGCSYDFVVSSLCEVSSISFDDYDGLIWYSFILKNKIQAIGLDA